MYYIGLTARLLLALVFVAAVLGKSWPRRSFDDFVAALSALRLFPRRLSGAAASATVAAEAVTVLLLAVPATVEAGFVVAMALLGTFIAGILSARGRGRQVPCRCFGAGGSTPLGLPHVIRNAALAVVAVLGLAADYASAGGSSHPGGVVLASVTAAVGAVLVVRMDDLLALAPMAR
ncbi:hypothetical protein LHJ74_11965 [Streptomyces sp. N2-109]|uniref:Methylamine utilisation protein MauE domain-containing protein n=1 Tax=Streptomyces gossypii TaxID=2883101 RepID=A0ABT2JT00_9ACTN|nr:MauE/DoxX family redox-associated membrane protein [Streptomyces gossypii]MCT2590614.1 hypothetical protein [Streptomyces gossypii]